MYAKRERKVLVVVVVFAARLDPSKLGAWNRPSPSAWQKGASSKQLIPCLTRSACARRETTENCSLED